MKNSITLALVGAWLAAGIAAAGAGSSSVPKTNWDSTISFTLTAYTTGVASPASITTKQIIQGLNGSTNALGHTNNFSPSAKLIYRQVLSGTNIIHSGQFVLDGTGASAMATDVSAQVRLLPGVPVGVLYGTKVTTYSYDQFEVVPGAPALYLEGVSTIKPTTILSGKARVLGSLNAKVAGTGVTGSGPTAVTSVVNGTVSFSGGKLE